MKKLFGVLLIVALLAGISTSAMAADEMTGFKLKGQVGVFTQWGIWDDKRAANDGINDGKGTTAFSMNPWDLMEMGVEYKGDGLFVDIVASSDDSGGVATANFLEFDRAVAQVDFSAFSLKFGYSDPLSFNPTGTPPGKYGNSGIGGTIGGTQKLLLDMIVPIGKKMKFEAEIAQPGKAVGTLTEVVMPNLEVALTGFAPFYWKAWAGYEAYKSTYGGLYADGEDLTAYTVGAVVRPKLGPAALNLTVNYSTNGYITQGSPWQWNAGGLPFSPPNWAYSKDDVTTRLGFNGSVAFQFNQMVGLTFGGGWQTFDCDYRDQSDPMIGYWVNLPLHMTKNFRIIPFIVI